MNDVPDAGTVLVVDDDEAFRERLVRAFRARGFDARTAPSSAAALQSAEEDSPEYAVVDLRMPEPSGLEVVKRLKAIDPTTKVLVLTGYGSIATALEAVRLGAVHYLTKPADVDDILNALTGEPVQVESPAIPTQAPSLARMEWEHINRVLVECGGNISKAARVLGLHRRSLQRKLSKHPVKR
jgi:two-component system response regulator RegA